MILGHLAVEECDKNQIWKVSVVDGFQLQENCAKVIFFWD